MIQDLTSERITTIVIVCHQAIRAFCQQHGDHSINDWLSAEEWQREATMNAVRFRIQNPVSGFEAMHEFWLRDQTSNGWTFGEAKDARSKTHPAIVPYEQLSNFEKQKDALFCSIVDALK